MQIIRHRCNSLSLIETLDHSFGAEIDVRDHNGELVLAHDPVASSESFISLDLFLKNWKASGTLILNIKSEGIELKCLELVNKYKVKDWFFLDLSMPYFVKFSQQAKSGTLNGFSPENLAVRFSDKEVIEYALSFRDAARWVWVDWFDEIALDLNSYRKLKEARFKICLVSPELQNKKLEFIDLYKKHLKENHLIVDAVCTKNPEMWMI